MVFGILDGKKKTEADVVCAGLDDMHEYKDEIVDELLNKVAELDNQINEIDKVQKVTVRKLQVLVASKENIVKEKKLELTRLQAKLDGAREPTSVVSTTKEEDVQPPEQTPLAEPTSSQEIDGEPKIVVMIFNDGVSDETIKKNEGICEGWINRYHINKKKIVKLTARSNLFGIRTQVRNADLFHKLNVGCLFVAVDASDETESNQALRPIIKGMCKIE